MDEGNMHRMIEGIYRKGHIEFEQPIPLKDNTKIKVWIDTGQNPADTSDFGIYELGKKLDKIHIRDFAHED